MTGIRANYFLVHRETGQRYPIKADVTIGRMIGDIVFARDPKLSTQHCRLTPIKGGIGVSDLDSANGTFIDGKRLKQKRVYLLKPKCELTAGEQVFALQSISVALPVRRRKKPGKQSSSFLSNLFLVILIAAGVALFATKWKKTESDATLQLAQRELIDIFDTYQNLRDVSDRQSASADNVAARMQSQVLGRLANLTNRLAAMPQPSAEKERRLLFLQQRFAGALSSETQSQVLYLTSGENRYLDDFDQWSDQVDHAAAEFRKDSDAHKIKAANLPEPILPPIQLVERAMRQALREYKKLGNQVQSKEVADNEVGKILRQELIPKLGSVGAQMSAIKPVGARQARRLALEQSLVAAFLSQVKTMAIYYDTKDARYAKDLDHWTEQIEKINGELKKQLKTGRIPAGL